MRSAVLYIFLGVIFLFPVIAGADSVSAAHTTVELLSDHKNIQPGRPIRVALKMVMDDGWHVYWKNPGDSGLSPTIVWDLPQGFQAGEIHWPVPHRINLGPLTSFGYEGEVLLISEISVPESLPPQTTVDIKAKVDWLTCQVDCIPGKADLGLLLPVNPQEPQIDQAAAADFDRTAQQWPIAPHGWTIKVKDRVNELIFEISSPGDVRPISDVLFYPDRDDLIDHSAAQRSKPLGSGIELRILKSTLFPQKLENIRGILVRSDGWTASGQAPSLLVDVPVEKVVENFSPSPGVPMTIWIACLSAFLGGLILNLMPCVLPVLSLKILGLLKHTSHRAQMLAHGLFFTAGILISFWILAGILILLRQAGQGVGWGFQFQSPWFVVGIALVLFLCALNLWGVFEVAVDIAPLSGLSRNPGYAGSFWGGVLATIVATPCTAPFMGTAIGFAIAQPPAVALAVFTCLALGMAMPYLILSAFPSVLRWIPKPGPWMVHLKSGLAFLLMGSVVWLIWVLGVQKGIYGVGLFLSGALCVSLGCWLLGLAQQDGASWRKSLPMFIAFLTGFVLMGAAAWGSYGSSERSVGLKSAGIAWREFSPETLRELRAQNRSVFIDFTAAWCLTCQVNDRLVFRNKDVETAFKDSDIVALKADWTNRDEVITQALAGYGKNSIPLYVFYPPGADDPVILPELITPSMIVERLRERGEKD